jgi:hypothetical protein
LYICPAGVYIGTTFYPQGFSFQAKVILFGKRADIECGMCPFPTVMLIFYSLSYFSC